MSSMAGMRKESVFPEPVFAAPTRSLPSNKCGMVLACQEIKIQLLNK